VKRGRPTRGGSSTESLAWPILQTKHKYPCSFPQRLLCTDIRSKKLC
jgi:hypothetical protein